MKIKQILVAFLFATLVISCGNKAKDIDVKELKTECEAVDAMIIVMDEALELVEAVDAEEGASEEQKKESESLKEKLEEITERIVELEMDDKALEKCPKYETLESKIKEVSETANIFK